MQQDVHLAETARGLHYKAISAWLCSWAYTTMLLPCWERARRWSKRGWCRWWGTGSKQACTWRRSRPKSGAPAKISTCGATAHLPPGSTCSRLSLVRVISRKHCQNGEIYSAMQYCWAECPAHPQPGISAHACACPSTTWDLHVHLLAYCNAHVPWHTQTNKQLHMTPQHFDPAAQSLSAGPRPDAFCTHRKMAKKRLALSGVMLGAAFLTSLADIWNGATGATWRVLQSGPKLPPPPSTLSPPRHLPFYPWQGLGIHTWTNAPC